jgi:hypothetical protein
LFLLGGSVLVQRFLPKTFVASEAPGWLAICCAAAALWGEKRLKERLVFTRGGHVELRRRWWPFVLSGLVLQGIVIVFLVLPGHRPRLDGQLVWPGFAIVFAVIALASGWQLKSPLRAYFGAYLLCLAPLMWWLPVTSIERSAVLEVGAGAPLAVGGALILRRFLKANPRRSETGNE